MITAKASEIKKELARFVDGYKPWISGTDKNKKEQPKTNDNIVAIK